MHLHTHTHTHKNAHIPKITLTSPEHKRNSHPRTRAGNDSIPVDKGESLLEHKGSHSVLPHRLLDDFVVPHKNAIPTPSKPVTGVPGKEKQEGKKGEGDDDLPRNGEPAGELGDKEQEGDEAERRRGDPEFDP